MRTTAELLERKHRKDAKLIQEYQQRMDTAHLKVSSSTIILIHANPEPFLTPETSEKEASVTGLRLMKTQSFSVETQRTTLFGTYGEKLLRRASFQACSELELLELSEFVRVENTKSYIFQRAREEDASCKRFAICAEAHQGFPQVILAV